MPKDTLAILLIDDSSEDCFLIAQAFKELGLPHSLNAVHDGVEALSYLHTRPVPDLILLDLHMPRMGGLEVLRSIRNHQDWRTIPVIVLTISNAEHDIRESYRRQANAYIRKPSSPDEFVNRLRHLQAFWTVVALVASKSPFR
ncbi:response regulator [Deinococcus peraridilitoris]|uniref:CheY-like receiver domain-containing protein n=1 Tax=Deinococcus peraridilitoris (strain DSM 19664 / LMG 22246 / CIP 109416 / KR-200) TaxID=937777 RepID=K9ZVW1_DEIPD|nr:response regulator [Deinococcus peraridilitoris]AFZ65676.1 CheY-like receiver domain-containing protein [Deinococcus peraridilitoris DSM 19664]